MIELLESYPFIKIDENQKNGFEILKDGVFIISAFEKI